MCMAKDNYCRLGKRAFRNEVGEQKKIHIKPEEGYGPVNPQAF